MIERLLCPTTSYRLGKTKERRLHVISWIHSGPVLKASVLLQMFAAGALYAWSGILPAVRFRFGATVGEVGLIFSLSIAAFTLAVLGASRFPAKTESGKNHHVAADLRRWRVCFVAALCLVLASQLSHFVLFAFVYSLGLGTCCGAIYMWVLQDVARAENPNLLTGYAVAAFGLGAVLLSPAMHLATNLGWGLLGLLIPAATLALAGSLGWAAAGRCKNQTGRAGRADRESITTKTLNENRVESAGALGLVGSSRVAWPVFWPILLISLGFAMNSAVGLFTLGLAGVLMEAREVSLLFISFGLGGVAIANTCGRLLAGMWVGRIGIRIACCVGPVVTLMGLGSVSLLGSVLDGAVAMVVGLVLVAGGYGWVASTYPIATRIQFGDEAYGRCFGVVFLGWGFAGLVAPWLAGRAFDVGGVDLVVWLGLGLVCGAMLLAGGMVWLLRFSSPASQAEPP